MALLPTSSTGFVNEKLGYESLTEVAMMISRTSEAEMQRDLVVKSLEKAFPTFLLKMASYLWLTSCCIHYDMRIIFFLLVKYINCKN
jgi:hypothetical protein